MAGGEMGAQGGMSGQGGNYKRGLFSAAEHLMDHVTGASEKVDQVSQTVQGVQQILPGQGGMGGQGQYKKTRRLMHHAMHLASHHGTRLLDHTDTLSQKIGDVSMSVQSVQQMLPGQGGGMGGQGQYKKRTLQAVMDYHLARREDCSS